MDNTVYVCVYKLLVYYKAKLCLPLRNAGGTTAAIVMSYKNSKDREYNVPMNNSMEQNAP